jgi:dienelactone hydrolase
MSPSTNSVRLFCLLAFAVLFGTAAVAQSSAPAPTPALSSPVPSSVATPSPSPATEAAQPGAPTEYPKLSYPDLLPRFDYDSHTGLDMRQTNVEKRGGVRLIELNYAGAGGDRVPAYLLIPPGKGPFAGIIWGHWLKKGSPLANKDEFLEEAISLAQHSGVVSLLIDAPQVRHDFVPEKDLMASLKQQSEAAAHQVIDLRRAVDLLSGRHDVDRKRIGYVGHSWNAHVGAILAGVETRITCYVLMASGYSEQEEAFSSKDPEIVAYRKQLGDDALREYFHEYAWDDPVYFLGHTDREGIFLQFASGDPISKEMAQKYLNSFSAKDKKLEFYDAPHALNAAARLDRARWLQKQLGLKKVDEKELGEIPQLK